MNGRKKVLLFNAKRTFSKEVLNGLDLRYDLDIARFAWKEWMKQIGENFRFPKSFSINFDSTNKQLKNKCV